MTPPLEKKNMLWLWSIFLYIPVILYYAAHVYSPLIAQGMKPTMFISFDMFSYMADAREYYDSSTFHLFYQNPFTDSDNSNHIYFQPHIFLLGMLMKICGDYPGIIFSTFGFISGVVCLRLLTGFYHAWAGLDSPPKKIILIILCWGGGLLSLSGFVYHLGQGQDIAYAYKNSAVFDPFDGWWFLNFGRNLIFPTEAYYHAVFIGAVFALYAKRYILFVALVFLLSLSHPFTGTQLLLISLAYFFVEKYIIRNTGQPSYVFWSLLGIAFFHFGYYMVYLMRDPEHSILVEQWSRNWNAGFMSSVLAYCLTGALFIANINTLEKAKKYFVSPFNRFLLAWFLTSLLLESNGLFMPHPIQPSHFTRGYSWLALFLMGYPALLKLISFLWERSVHRYVTIPLLAVIFMSDNLLWMPLTARDMALNQYFYMTPELADLFTELKKEKYQSHLVVANDQKIAYWITVYTPLRSWSPHDFSTSNALGRQFDIHLLFIDGIITHKWKGRKILVLIKKYPGYDVNIKKVIALMNREYESQNSLVYSGQF